MPDPNLAARAEVLAGAVASLTDSVQRLAESQARIRKLAVTTAIGLLVDFILTVAGIVLFVNQRDINNRLVDANARIEAVQSRTSDQVLCPLYKLFIAFEPRAKDNPQFTPQERTERAHAYEVIHQGFATLGCQ